MRQISTNVQGFFSIIVVAIKLCFSNICGILFERECVVNFLDSEKSTIFSVCETFLTAKYMNIFDLIHQENFILRDHIAGNGSGVFIYIINSLSAYRLLSSDAWFHCCRFNPF